MIVVNFLGAPGSGKSTAAAKLYAVLSEAGLKVELVTEYMKDVVWNRQLDLINNQDFLFANQRQRLTRLEGKIDVAITDSPLILSAFYNDNPEFPMEEFKPLVWACWHQFDNVTVFLTRGHDFQQEGRIHEEDECVEIHDRMSRMFNNHIDFRFKTGDDYIPTLIDTIVEKLQK